MELQVFKNEEFGNVRTVDKDGKPFFVANDVARALGYAEPAKAIRTHCKGVSETDIPTHGGIQTVKIIPEGDIYRLIIRSKLPSAERFETWIFDNVIPSIRKHGGYIAGQENLSPEEIVARALVVADGIIKEQKAQIEEMTPKAVFADAVSESESSILIRELAKLLKQNGIPTGEKRLYQWLRDHEYIMKNNTMPTQKSMELGLLEVVERTIQNPGKSPMLMFTTKVTGKGQQYFINKLLKEKVSE